MASENHQPPYARSVSSMERFALAINEIYRYNIVVMIEGLGSLSHLELQSAVDIASASNPGSRVRLKYFLGFSKWVDSGIAPQVKEVHAPDWDGYSERGALFTEEEFRPLDGGPVCDFILIQGPTTRLLVRVLHAVMDGRGLVHFIKDVFRVLRGEPTIGARATLTSTDITAKFQDKVRCTHQEMSCIPILPPSDHNVSNVRYLWRRVYVNKNMGSILPRMAVFLAQYARRENVGDVGFTVPVDLRGLREKVLSTANLTSMLYIKVEPDDTAKTVMMRINQNIRDYADCITPTIMKLVPWMPISIIVDNLRKNAEKLLYQTSDSLSSAGIVSIGLLRREDFSCPQFSCTTCMGIPPSVGKMNVIMINFDDHTEVSFSTPEAYNKEGQLDRMIGEFRKYVDS